MPYSNLTCMISEYEMINLWMAKLWGIQQMIKNLPIHNH